MLKSSFELLNDSTREEHPLTFLATDEKCYAFAKGDRGFFYVVRNGATWKIIHVTRRNQKTGNVVWRRYAPDFPTPPTNAKLAYFEGILLEEKKVKLKKPKYPTIKDAQRKKFYDWENRTLRTIPGLNEYWSIVEANNFADEICANLKIKRFKVRYTKQRKNYASGGLSYGSVIEILDANKQTVLHETAHVLHANLVRQLSNQNHKYHQHHGPEFVAFYAYVFKRYGDFDSILECLDWEEIQYDKEIYRKMMELDPEQTVGSIDSE